MKNFDKYETRLGYVLVFLCVVALNVFVLKLLWSGVRSLCGKTLNLAPSNRRWCRTEADVIQDEYTSEKHFRYYYDYVEYTADAKDFDVNVGQAMIYVKRSNPTVLKRFIPRAPLSKEAAISYFFIAAVVLFFESIYFFA